MPVLTIARATRELKLQTKSPPVDPFTVFDFEVGLTSQTGNIESLIGGIGVKTFRRWDDLNIYLAGSYAHGETAGFTFMNKAQGTFRIDYGIYGNLRIFGFSTHAYNEFLKLDYRTANGFGPWWDLQRSSWSNGLSIAITWENEKWVTFANERATRLSIRNMLSVEISKTAKVGFDAFYIPNFAEWADFRLYIIPFIETTVWENKLGLKYSVTLERDNRPKLGVVKNDIQMNAAFTLHLGE